MAGITKSQNTLMYFRLTVGVLHYSRKVRAARIREECCFYNVSNETWYHVNALLSLPVPMLNAEF